MARDILGEYGPDSPSPAQPNVHPGPTSGGGKPMVKPLPYSPPTGPTNINDGRSPGLHGSNMGNCGTQHE